MGRKASSFDLCPDCQCIKRETETELFLRFVNRWSIIRDLKEQIFWLSMSCIVHTVSNSKTATKILGISCVKVFVHKGGSLEN